VDKDGKCSIVHSRSRKSKRVTTSTLAAEIFALLHGYDIGGALQDLVSEILGTHVVMKLYTDTQICWDSVTSLCSTTENWLLIEISEYEKHIGHRQAYSSISVESIRSGVLQMQ
jgi:hypothetical protein